MAKQFKKVLIPFLCVAIVCFCIPHIVTHKTFAENESALIVNPNFEAETFDPWYSTSADGSAKLSLVTNDRYSGSKCVKISGRTASWNSIAQNITLKVENKKKYSISCWVKLSDEYGNEEREVKIGTSEKTDGKAECYDKMIDNSTNKVLANKNEWKQISTYLTVNYSTSIEKLELKIGEEGDELSAGHFGDFLVDNVEMKEVVAPESSIETDIPSLYSVFDDGTKFGAAVPANAFSNPTRIELIKKHFNSITAENEFKPSSFLSNSEPTADKFDDNGYIIPNFSQADPYIQFAKENDIAIRGHVLIWHNQTPEWFFRENYKNSGALVGKAEMTNRIRNYIKSVMEHFDTVDSPIYAWDVVNEAIELSDCKPNGLRNSNYYKIYGNYDYIIEAFKAANEFAPESVKLFYNDYSETDINKCNKICDLLTAVKNAEGTRIDGMGMQAHYHVETPSDEAFKAAARKYAQIVDEIQITELDMQASNDYNGNKEIEYIKQAYKFKELYDAVNELKTDGVNITSFSVWGTTDDTSWLQMPEYSNGKEHFPLLFDKNFKAKPAYWAFVDSSKLEPRVQTSAVLHSNDNNWDIAPNISFGNSQTTANAKLLWSDNKLNIKFDVVDATNDNSDAIKIYIDKNNDKGNSLNEDDYTININRSDCTETTNGYTTVKCIPLDSLNNNDKIGIDFVVIDSNNKYSWSDFNNSQETQTKFYGEIIFKPFIEIANGTPVVDGEIDEIWNTVSDIEIKSITSNPLASATCKTMWDSENLYVLAKVKDSVLNCSSANDYEQDSFEVFLDQNNAKASSYQTDDCQYRINFENEHSFNGVNCVEENIVSFVQTTNNGYNVEIKIKLTDITPQTNDLIGVDFQINDANGSGKRIGLANWYDSTGNGWQNPSVFGTARLVYNATNPLENKVPVANSDTDNTDKNSAVTTDVLSNDTDSDGSIDASTLTVTLQPTNGNVVIENGKITYTPNADYVGTDSYKYTVSDDDEAVSNEAQVTVIVSDGITPPPQQDGDVTFEFNTTNDWETGFVGKFTITNNSDTAITNWQLTFDWDKSITNLYTSQLNSHSGDSYVISGYSWNNTINSGETLELEFQGKNGNVTNSPENVVLTGDNFSYSFNN